MQRSSTSSRFRRTERHLLGARGQAVAVDGFRMIGERFLDASAEGVLLACDDRVRVGESVVLTFPIPGSRLVFDAEAEVVRIVEGYRDGDQGYCAALRFTAFDRADRLALGIELRALPQVGRRVRWGHVPAPRPSAPARSVVLRSIVRVA